MTDADLKTATEASPCCRWRIDGDELVGRTGADHGLTVYRGGGYLHASGTGVFDGLHVTGRSPEEPLDAFVGRAVAHLLTQAQARAAELQRAIHALSGVVHMADMVARNQPIPEFDAFDDEPF